jgi:hypothetical protein
MHPAILFHQIGLMFFKDHLLATQDDPLSLRIGNIVRETEIIVQQTPSLNGILQ